MGLMDDVEIMLYEGRMSVEQGRMIVRDQGE